MQHQVDSIDTFPPSSLPPSLPPVFCVVSFFCRPSPPPYLPLFFGLSLFRFLPPRLPPFPPPNPSFSPRNRRVMMVTMLQALHERRQMGSLFESAGSRAEAIAEASITAASAYLNPRNGPAGCGLWRLCRRLGCDKDVLPLLRLAGISGAEALRWELRS